MAVAQFLQEHPDFSIEDVDAPWFEKGQDGTFRLWPHKLLGEGHFAAVLRRTSGEEPEEVKEAAGEKLPSVWVSFAKELDIQLPEGKAIAFGQSLFWTPEGMPDIRGLKVLRPGLELGEVKKDRFEPAHALALWLRSAQRVQSFPWDSREMAEYMHGLTVPSSQKGWCLVQVDGFSIGWGKGDGKVLKNHYPKGLRR